MSLAPHRLGILCAGGPAPGLNSVIGAATIRASLSGVEVLGILDGFQHLMEGDTTHAVRLRIEDVSRLHFRGGSSLGISRANPTLDPRKMENTLRALRELGVNKLLTIGGDGTAASAWRLAQASKGALRVVHVPKTIDNDLDLPAEIDTFGFQTARHFGVEIVSNLMNDARTTRRWYIVVTMGRKAGHLALGIGKAAGATITVIPEEFPDRKVDLKTLTDTLAGAMIKRVAHGRPYGVAVVAEGLIEALPPEDLAPFDNGERDQHGNLVLSELSLATILKDSVKAHLRERGLKTTVVGKDIGYELRCCDPIPFDMEYTRDLGYCAARFIIDGGTGAMVSMQGGHFIPIPFEELVDLTTGRAKVRMVDVESERYRIARTYMIRLRHEDFVVPSQLARLAEVVGLTPEAFSNRYGYLAANDPGIGPLRGTIPPAHGDAVPGWG